MTLLDSGFVPLNPASVSGESVFYTFPQILQNGGKVKEGIVLVYHCFSPFVEAYRGGCPVELDEKKYVPALIDFVLGNNRVYNYHVTEGLLERQVKEIWNVVKNEKALPLPVDLYCAVTLTRLRAPPCCLLELPPDFLAKILKCLQVEDVARVSCVCKELQNLPNDECDDELWKQKLGEEYGTSLVKSIDQLYRYWIGEEDLMSWRSWFVDTLNNEKEKYRMRYRSRPWSWKEHHKKRT